MIVKIIPVNGYWIRQTLDPDFTIFHRHGSLLDRDYSCKPYIPKGELWVDHLHLDELSYLLQVEKKFTGLTGPAYRQKRQEILGEMKRSNRLDMREFIVRKERRNSGPVILFINGPKIRRYIDPEFVQGGHHFVYDYINQRPRQIWIDASMNPRDYPHVGIHEIRELELMTQGETYDIAHEIAMAHEKKSRIAAGGSYPGFENSKSFTPKRLLKYYFDLTK